MSYLFAFNEDKDRQTTADWFASHPYDPEHVAAPPDPGFFTGFGSEALHGLERGAITGAAGVARTGIGLVAGAQGLLGGDAKGADAAFQALDQWEEGAVRSLTPGPGEVGWAGRVLGGALEGVGEFTAGLGGFGFGSEAGKQVAQAGGTTGEAVLAAGTAGAIGEAFRFPGVNLFNKTLTRRLVSGTAGIPILGEGGRVVQNALLGAAGRPDLQTPFSGTNLGAEIAQGLIFGALGRPEGGSSEERDAYNTLNQEADQQKGPLDSQPADLKSANANVSAKLAKLEELYTGRPTTPENLPPDLDEAKFTPDPQREEQDAQTQQEVRDFAKTNGVDVSEPLKEPKVEAPAEELAAGKVIGFSTAKGSTYKIEDDGTTTRNKALRPEHPGEQGLQPTSERTYYVTDKQADQLSLFQTQGDAKRITETKDGRLGVQYIEGKDKGKFEGRTVVEPQHEPKIGLTPVELWKEGQRVHFGNKITELHYAEPKAGERSKAISKEEVQPEKPQLPGFHYEFDDGQSLPWDEAQERLKQEYDESAKTQNALKAAGECLIGSFTNGT